MAANGKVIITCAVTGAIHTPSMSPYLPVTADEIAETAIGAAEAGAAIFHLHACDERTGRPDQKPEAFERFLPRIKQSPKAVVNLTTGGAPYMTVQEREKPAEAFKPEVASLNMGSMNFGLFPMLNRFKSFKHDWEPQELESSRDLVFRNTFQGHRIRAAHARRCRGPVRVRVLRHFTPLQPGALFGARPRQAATLRADSLRHLGRHRFASQRRDAHEAHCGSPARRTLQMVGAWGRPQPMPIAAMAAAMGGHVRVGLEDSLWSGPGRLATSNGEQVRAARQILEGLGLSAATPDEAREILELKGGDQVAF